MKETNEAFVFGAKAINTGYDIMEDGEIKLDDLSKAISLIFAGQTGIDGFSEIGPEQSNIGPDQKKAIRANIIKEMTKTGALDGDDWADVLMGGLSGYRLGQRAGRKEAEKAILRSLKERGLQATIEALEAS